MRKIDGQGAATLEGLTRVVADPMRFKAKLAIGEDAYASLKATRTLGELWQVTGVAAAGGVAASSTTVASAFFGSWITGLGLVTAVTPVGWVVGAATAAGAAGWGVIHLLRRYEGSRVQKVPRFITTPLDLLGASLFDLIGALALMVAREAEQIDETERAAIRDYFVQEWGLDPDYVARALPLIEAGLDDASIEGIARALADFKRENPDCNYDAMTAEVVTFLTEIAEADGQVSEAESAAIARIGKVFRDAAPWSVGKLVGAASDGVGSLASSVAETPGWIWGKLAGKAPAEVDPPEDVAKPAPPVPVVWLLGKTGAGKSSLVRAMTGASAAEIGNGFVPCTRTSLAFDYPPAEPVMRFLDTRGLGEIAYDPAEDLAACHDAAHVLLVLARLDDPVQGAVAEALLLARRGRKLPALLVHTAPDLVADPEARARVRHANQSRLDTAWGEPLPSVELDLGNPDSADLSALAETLTGILPSVALFLDRQSATDAEEAEFLRNRGLVLRYSGMASAGGAVPVPLVGAASVPVLQARMLAELATRYGIDWDRSKLAALATALGVSVVGGQALRLVSRQLVSLIPVIGQTAGPVLGAGWGFGSTWALGRAAAWWMFQLRAGKPVDVEALRTRYADALKGLSNA
ncbi:TerB family tellurite resistance protein [Gemmobacter aquaticus]|uniref:TerB family tellurite resistance protein n=1 Tax=Gemmobacter aquaticus TaxID=490185 RepID=UPI0011B63824|nr:TerB family tellurite resistance protein [Gemmobacter aquaticus]